MRQNSKNRFNVRHNNRGHRSQIILRNTALDSTGPAGKLHGTALQLFEKYQAAAKDAQIQNDAILTETYLQYADHYMRIQNQAIENEEASRAAQFARKNEQKTPALAQNEEKDTLPTFDIPAMSISQTPDLETTLPDDEVITTENQDLKEIDLSVPVLAIQENHKEKKRSNKSSSKTLRLKKEEQLA